MLADCNLVFTILFTIECVMKLGSFGYKVGNSEYRLNDITMACCEWRRFGRLVIFRLMAIQTSFLLDKARDRVCTLEYFRIRIIYSKSIKRKGR